jgi:S1-C subfamily serine protease
MRLGWVYAALLLIAPIGLSGQAPGVLRITVTLMDAERSPLPVPRHLLLVSDNPSTSPPRRLLTRADGSIEVSLRPGNYTVESDHPVVSAGKAFQWTVLVDVVAGREVTLALTAANADAVPLPESASPAGEAPADIDTSLRVRKWQQSLVSVWSPTARASGFVVDSRGLIATDGVAVGTSTAVEVQVSPTVKLAARVLVSDAARGVAILWVDPESVAGNPPAPLTCPPAAASTLDEGRAIVALTAPYAAPMDAVDGEVTTLAGRSVETDLRLRFGGAGGPAFNTAGEIVGLTSASPAAEPGRPAGVKIVRAGVVCDTLAAARESMTSAAAPTAGRLPIEPSAAAARGAIAAAATSRKPAPTPVVLSESDFDVALITPTMLARSGEKADWTGGASGRSMESEAKLGRLMEFGGWSDYFADVPPVLVVRVSPKLVEGFWKRLAREAARTQGAELPPFKDFSASFLRLHATCGGEPIVPIHPFVLEHRLPDKRVIREGLYVFDPASFRAECGSVILSLYAEKTPQRAQTLSISAATLSLLKQD